MDQGRLKLKKEAMKNYEKEWLLQPLTCYRGLGEKKSMMNENILKAEFIRNVSILVSLWVVPLFSLLISWFLCSRSSDSHQTRTD